MKKIFTAAQWRYFRCLLPVFVVLLSHFISGAYAQKKEKEPEITFEQIAEKCKDLPRSQRVVIKVARFSVSAKSSQAHNSFGDELATMLTSALQQTNCFRVMETNKNLTDTRGEIAFDQSGSTMGNGPQAGQALGAQLLVTGEITDFSEGTSSKSFGVVATRSNQATVGFTLKMINPQTGEVLFSKDVNMKGSNSGKSFDFFGVKTASSNENRAVQDATQKAIIKAVEVWTDAKDKIEIPEPQKPKEIKHYTAQNCSMLRAGSPKVIILVTEATTAGTANGGDSDADLARREREMYLRQQEADSELARQIVSNVFKSKKRRLAEEEAEKNKAAATTTQTSATAEMKKVVIEQTATETELTRHFVESGFRVVDPKIYGKMRQISDSAGGDLGQMAALGLKMGANIIVTGQAISERISSQGGMTSCRARLEIRVIATEDGSILATNTVSAGGLDISEAVANKVALHNASENMSQYLIERLCGMNIQFANGGKVETHAKTTSNSTSEILISNVNFSRLQVIAASLLKNSNVKGIKKSIKGTEGTLVVEHTGSTDDLVEALGKLSAVKFEVAELEEGKVRIAMQ